MKSYLLLLLLFLFAFPLNVHSFFEHQGYLYGGVGASRAWVDAYANRYTHVPAVFGLGYRLNWHGGGRHVLEFGLSLGAATVLPMGCASDQRITLKIPCKSAKIPW